MTTSVIVRKVLVYGGVVALVIAVLGGIVGILVSGVPGLLSAVLGTAVALVFVGISLASVLAALKVSRGHLMSVRFFSIVIVAWVVKFAVFLALVVAVGGLAWLDSRLAFGTIVAAVVGSIVVDVIVIAGARQPLDAALDTDDDTLGGPAKPTPSGRGAVR